MEVIYNEYLEWFRAHAVSNALPVEIDELLRECIYVDEDNGFVKAYYIQLVVPSVSLSGKLEAFIISEISTPIFEDDGIVGLDDTHYMVCSK